MIAEQRRDPPRGLRFHSRPEHAPLVTQLAAAIEVYPGIAGSQAAVEPLDRRALSALDALAFDPLRTLGLLYALAFDPLRPLGLQDALALDPLRTFSLPDALALDPLRPLRPLNALTFNAPRPLDLLDALTLGPLRTLGPLDALTLGPLRTLGPLDALTFGPLRTLGPLDALALGSLRPLNPLLLGALRTIGPLRTLRLGLTRVLVRLRATIAISIAAALAKCRAGQRQAGNTSDQQKLASHLLPPRQFGNIEYQRAKVRNGPVRHMNLTASRLRWSHAEGNSAPGCPGFIFERSQNGQKN